MSTTTQQVNRTGTLSIQALRERVTPTRLAVAGLFAAILIYHAVTLLRTPPAFVDEAWNASRSWGLLKTGIAFGTLDAGVFDKYEGYWTLFPWLGTALHVPGILVFGPGLLAMRLTSLLFGLALLAVVYGIGARLYGRRVGMLAVLLTATATTFAFTSHVGRHDIMVTAMGFGAVALYFSEERGRLPWKSLLAGLLVGLTLDIHANGVVYGPALMGLYLYDHRLAILKSRRFWAFALGGAAGLLFFVAMHLMAYPQTYFALFNLGNGNLRTPPLFILDPLMWVRSFWLTLEPLGLPIVVLIAAAVVTLWRNRSAEDSRLMILFALLLLAFTVLIRGKAFFYTVLILPAAALLIAALLERMLKAPWRSSPIGYARNVLVWALVAVSVVVSLYSTLRYDFSGDFERTTRTIAATIPAGSRVLGAQTYWFALPGEQYYSWEQIVYYRRHAPGSTFDDALRELRPDYLVIDEWVEGALKDEQAIAPEDRPFLYVPKGDLDTFLGGQGELVEKVESEAFGSVRVYRIDWN